MLERILAAYERSDYDFRRTAKPDDVLRHLFDAWVPYYRLKAAIAAALQPATILEIGVRHGYSAAAFLHGSPAARYTGIDLDADSFGGERGAIDWARRILPPDRTEFVIGNSQKMRRLPGGRYDLVHIDGQQDEAGTFHDLVLALRQARHILVDGYFWTEQNNRAVNDFLWRFREDIESAVVVGGYAGEMLITVKESIGATGSDPESSATLRHLYSRDYFLNDCGGWEFFASARQNIILDGRLRAMADLLFARPGRRVLDLGCGRGELALLAAEAGWEVVAVDYSAAAIDILKETLAARPEVARRVTCVCANVATWVPDGAFDVVLAADLVEHLSPQELDSVYARVAAHLAPEGRFIVHTFPNRWFYDYDHRRRRAEAARLGAHLPANPRSRFELLMHINEQSPPRMRRQLRAHFAEVLLWFGSPEEPARSLHHHCSPRELGAQRDLFAVASHHPGSAAQVAALFAGTASEERDFVVEVEHAPQEAVRSSTVSARVRLTNRSRRTVLASRAPFPAYLSYRWLDAVGRPLPLEGWRNPLVPALVPGGSHAYVVQLTTPPEPGRYTAVFSLVQEHKFWLCDELPVACPRREIRIT